jgi:hypothetical protein
MSHSLTPSTDETRERIAVFLAVLTSEACWDACRPFISHEDLAATLCRIWFDDIYVPGHSYLQGLKGDRTEASVGEFWSHFTDEERAVMERFHGCLELRLDLLSNRSGGRAFFPDNDSWRSILRDARALLQELVPEPEQLRGLVDAIVKRVSRAPENLLSAPPWQR